MCGDGAGMMMMMSISSLHDSINLNALKIFFDFFFQKKTK